MIDLDNAAVSFENFFPNPHLVRLKALTQKYYSREEHPDPAMMGVFPGKRTEIFTQIDRKLDKYFIHRVADLLGFKGKIPLSAASSFSFTDAKAGITFHRDDALYYGTKTYAGVVYLNPDIEPEAGTIVEGRLMPAKFNRLVLYDGRLLHSIAKTFGSNRFNSRLVLTTFYSFLTDIEGALADPNLIKVT